MGFWSGLLRPKESGRRSVKAVVVGAEMADSILGDESQGNALAELAKLSGVFDSLVKSPVARNEWAYLQVAGFDLAVALITKDQPQIRDAISEAFYTKVTTACGAKRFAELRRALAEYAEAINRRDPQHGTTLPVGKVFAKRCAADGNLVLALAAGSAFVTNYTSDVTFLKGFDIVL